MSGTGRVMHSGYMQWARTRSHARFNLATSGVPNLPIAELPVAIEDLEITGRSSYGYAPLQEALAAKCGVAPGNVVAAAGTSMANHLAMAALVEPGDGVVMEHPVYDPIAAVARYVGADVRFFARRHEADFRVDPDDVARLVTPRTRLVVLTNLHNPSGVMTQDETLAGLGEVARAVGARVLVDEVYLDAAFDRAPRSAFHLGPEFVVTNSLTKVYGVSGLRCGWVLADEELARRIWHLNDLFGVTGAHPAERLSVVALRHLDRLRERARVLLEANRRALHAFYDSRDDVDAVRTAYGTTSFPRLRAGSADRLCALLREKYETTVVPGTFFGMEDHFRIGLTCDTATFASGLERLGSALDEL